MGKIGELFAVDSREIIDNVYKLERLRGLPLFVFAECDRTVWEKISKLDEIVSRVERVKKRAEPGAGICVTDEDLETLDRQAAA